MEDKKLFISTKFSGKMEGMQGLTTSCLDNPICLARMKDKNCVCSKCYAARYLNMRPLARKRYSENTQILMEPLGDKDIPVVNASIFRFESFGDLLSMKHLCNYITIARRNPNTTFTLFTKMKSVILDYLHLGELFPDNFLIVLSQSAIDSTTSTEYSELLELCPNCKVFRVFTKKYAEDDHIPINCGGNKCIKCQRCYKRDNHEHFINEILK